MRFIWAAIFLTLTLPVLGQQPIGPKKDIIATPIKASASAPIGWTHMLQMIVALLIVVALIKYLVPKFVIKMNRRLSPTVSSTIKIEESAVFAGGNLYVITAREKILLVCVGQQGVNCLADLTPAKLRPNTSSDEIFFELLDEAQKKISDKDMSTPKAATWQEASPRRKDLQHALDRLENLAS